MLLQEHKNRLSTLRDAAVAPQITYDQFRFAFYDKLSGNQELGTFEYRYVDAYKWACEQVTPVIDPGELIVGKCRTPLTQQQEQRWQQLQSFVETISATYRGQDSHMGIDYDLVLSRGLKGIMDTVWEKKAACSDPAKIAFYDSCLGTLQGAIRFAERYAEYAQELANLEEDHTRKSELTEIARICQKVPAEPAGSFYEAVQSAHFITLCLSFDPMRHWSMQLFQLGRPDRYLWPYYEKDIKSGKLTREEAQLLLDCLGIQINNRVSRGLSTGYMVGGRDSDGKPVANELTELCMNVVEDNRLVYPAVGLCYVPEMPDRYLKRACEILAQGCSHPAIFNDDVIAKGLQIYGVPERDSRRYIHSTCVEVTPEAASNVWVASPYINLVAPLLQTMEEDHETMASFLEAVFVRLDKAIKDGFEDQNESRKWRAERSINPLLSCVVNDCLERGVDIERGGARYNWIMPSFVGMANLADCLNTIDEMVFKQRKYTMAQLRQMTDANFEGYEAQRLELLNKVEKYGNDDDTADCWCNVITDHIVKECSRYTPVLPDARLVPSVFCWVMHEELGKHTGATPDGRKAGFPLGDGSGPAQGRERKGPTASVLSSTKWSHQEFIGGVAVNMKFSKSAFRAESCGKMMALIKSFMERGGFEIQINVIDREILLDAQKNPEQYQDLVVRVGGYSDYFVHLGAGLQAEVLLRTEHTL